ncbi:hypothetical protein QVD17_17300 [Tagetes erecta]|uniref:Uncharacterized protein n=1 Tax=Tagetes erecta TaxID=13708 RepID=A0AAD8KS10_TARER|nr:hypothetical protein QVD17_17300 [Tagetes erecta]
MKMTKEDITRVLTFASSPKKDDVTSRVGNKVLPVNESNTTSSSSKNPNMNSSIVMKKENGDRTKTTSRMKELLRWAANVKSEKGGKYIARKVSQFRSKRTLKMIEDDQTTNDSPKISFRWEVESCSTFSSALSVSSTTRNDQHVNFEIHPNPDGNSRIVTLRSGSWITTDSDFVVLEL